MNEQKLVKKKKTNIKKPQSVGYIVNESSWFSTAAVQFRSVHSLIHVQLFETP